LCESSVYSEVDDVISLLISLLLLLLSLYDDDSDDDGAGVVSLLLVFDRYDSLLLLSLLYNREEVKDNGT
jgi:hypothetical protein